MFLRAITVLRHAHGGNTTARTIPSATYSSATFSFIGLNSWHSIINVGKLVALARNCHRSLMGLGLLPCAHCIIGRVGRIVTFSPSPARKVCTSSILSLTQGPRWTFCEFLTLRQLLQGSSSSHYHGHQPCHDELGNFYVLANCIFTSKTGSRSSHSLPIWSNAFLLFLESGVDE